MLALLFSALILGAGEAVTLPPTLDGGWKIAPAAKEDYAHYVRTQTDGSTSELIASGAKCDCQPADTAQLLAAVLNGTPGANVHRSTATMCGVQAERVTATGMASSQRRDHNIDEYFFRKNGSFYSLTYTFNATAPSPDGVAALAKLCP